MKKSSAMDRLLEEAGRLGLTREDLIEMMREKAL